MPPDARRKAGRIEPSTFAAVIRAYLASPKYAALGPSTQYGYRHYLELAERPETLGAIPTDVIRPSLVQAFLDGLSDRPGAQQRARVALKAVERWALVRDLLTFPITTGTEIIGSKGGHRPWSDAQVALVEQRGRPFLARAVTLAANTGQRGSDLVRMGPTDLETYDGQPGINVTQRKTGLRIWIPLTPALREAMETWERRPGPFLRGADDTPLSRHRLSMAWERERDVNQALRPCAGLVMHGLRATAVVRLRRAGAPATQIADMVGLSVAMVERYCRFADQRDNALAAVHHLRGTSAERAGRARGKVTR